MKKLSFKDVCEKLEYIEIKKSKEKTTDEVSEEIREFIRSYGWECLDDGENEEEWLENHPEISKEDCEHYVISENEFLCDNDGFFERINDHDVDWYTFGISYYGVWIDDDTSQNVGVFYVWID